MFADVEEVPWMATSLRPAPSYEPSTDFPTLDLVPPPAKRDRSVRWMTAVLILAGTILVGMIGFAVGQATAGIPAACERALDLADRTAALAVADLRTIREGMLVFLYGEAPEAYSILGDAQVGGDGLRGYRTELAIAAEACLAAQLPV